MPFLVDPANTWELPIFLPIARLSEYINILLEDEDSPDTYRITVEAGDVSTATETERAIRGLTLLLALSSAIHKFNHPDDGTSTSDLANLKEEIKRYYDEWEECTKDNTVYSWLHPDQDHTKVVLKYSREEGPAGYYRTQDLPKNLHYEFAGMCKSGNLELAKWLVDWVGINHTFNSAWGFRSACGNGHLELAKWIHGLGDIDVHVVNDHAFHMACHKGHLDVMNWLYDFGDIDVHYGDHYGFCIACQKGHLEVAKWIHRFGGIDVLIMNHTFRMVAWNGRLDVGKWMYDLGGLNVHSNNDNAFRGACERGHEEFARWLYYDVGGGDLVCMDNYAIRTTLDNGHHSVVAWIKSM